MASLGLSSFAAVSVKAGVRNSGFRSNGGKVFAAKEAANWLPGSTRPSYLDGSMPGGKKAKLEWEFSGDVLDAGGSNPCALSLRRLRLRPNRIGIIA